MTRTRVGPSAAVLVSVLAVALTWTWLGAAADGRRRAWTDETASLEVDGERYQAELTSSRERITTLEVDRVRLRISLDPAATAAVAEVDRLVRERRCGAFVAAGATGEVPPADSFADEAIAEVAGRSPGLVELQGWEARVDRGPLAAEVCVPPPQPPPEAGTDSSTVAAANDRGGDSGIQQSSRSGSARGGMRRGATGGGSIGGGGGGCRRGHC